MKKRISLSASGSRLLPATSTSFKLAVLFSAIFLTVLFSASQIFASHPAELRIMNIDPNTEILVTVTPIGAIMNGEKKYKLTCRYNLQGIYDNIYGGSKILTKYGMGNNVFDLNADYSSANGGTDASFGYGKYRVRIHLVHPDEETEGVTIEEEAIVSCIIDYNDADYGTSNWPSGFTSDIELYYNNGALTWSWDNQSPPSTIQIWDQRARNPSYLKTQNKNGFTTDQSWTDWPIDANELFNVPHISPSEFYVNLDVIHNGMNVKQNKTLNFNTANLTITNGKSFTVHSGGEMNFKDYSKLKTLHTSLTAFNMNGAAGINFVTNGRPELNYTEFKSSSSWTGMKLNNADGASITNCVFRDLLGAAYIDISNILPFNNPNYYIASNDFYISGGTNYTIAGIRALEAFAFIFNNNKFYFNVSSAEAYGISIASLYFNPVGLQTPRIISNNTFIGNFMSPIAVACFASNQFILSLTNNVISNNSTGYSYFRMVNAPLEYNSIVSSNTSIPALNFIQSNVSLYKNTIQNTNAAISAGYSYLKMEPQRLNGNLYWSAGQNFLKSVNVESLKMDNGFPYVNYGKNGFEKNNTNSYHLFGKIDGPDPNTARTFMANDNCWYGGSASIFLYTTDPSNPLPYSAVSSLNCPITVTYDGYDLIDLGDGYYDTVYYSEDDIPEPPAEDEFLYYSGQDFYNLNDYSMAMNYFKTIIDDMEESQYVGPSLYDLELCYNALDTSSVQEIKDILYSHFKNYLVLKFEQYEYNGEIADIIYNLILRTDVLLKNYQEALDGYEFLALYHPDAAIRLNASYDYSAVENYLDSLGNGGGIRSDLGRELQKREKRINKIIKNDPRMSTLRKNYEEKENEKSMSEDSRKDVSGSNRSAVTGNRTNKVIEEKVKLKARENIVILNSLPKKEKIERYLKDIKLLSLLSSGDANVENLSIPQEYILHQNYPNPFNPATKIKFSIPEMAMVKLTVYDISGRLIKELRNAVTEAGSHEITFDGTGLSSGIYFYKLTAISDSRHFESVKKMIFIK